MKLYKRFKRYLKNRFFRVLSFFTVLILFIVPFSASAVEVDYSNSYFHVNAVSLFLVGPNGSTINIPDFSTEFTYQEQTDSSFLTLTFSAPSQIVNSVYSLRYMINITSDVEYGDMVNFSFENNIHTTDAYSVVQFPLYLTIDNKKSSLTALKQGDYAVYNGELSLSADGRTISNSIFIPTDAYKDFNLYGDIYFSKTVRDASYISLTFKNIKLNGGFNSPDGSSVESYITLEHDFLESLDTDFSPTVDLVTNEAKNSIIKYASSFMAVQSLFDKYALNLGIVGSLLYISLTLGILAVLLNVGSTVAGRISGNISRSNARSNARSNRSSKRGG